MRVKLLGGFEVSLGARPIPDEWWRLRKARNLVKLLALASDHRLHREQATALLWPDLGSRAASNNLHHALHAARAALGSASGTTSHHLSLKDERLALCPNGSLWVDVEVFERAAATARLSREPAAYQAALELYAGELLPEDRYEVWAEGRRSALRRTRLTLLTELAEVHEGRGDLGAAMVALQEVIAHESAHEGAHAGLMRLYAASGRRYEALRQYERLKELLWREFGAEPEAESRRLYEQILAGRVSPFGPTSAPRLSERAHAPRHNLPFSLTRFVGREREISGVEGALVGTRLLTLIGAGGSGKTRLALEVARDLTGVYPDGVWLVELAPLAEAELVPQAVAAAMGVREQPGRSIENTLGTALRTKILLLVLDNCEHLVDEVARLVETLLNSCPDLRVLATSREVLGVAGEATRVVPSLSLSDPEQPASARRASESVRLFVDRARQRWPGFALTEENSQVVAEICRRLDGVPLALELAAARVGVLTVAQIAARLDDALGLLTEGGRTAAPRQQTLRATLDWSYELLDEPERILFGRLSVFVGGFTLEAAETVGTGAGVGGEGLLDLLGRLVHKSLVVAEAVGGGALRYRMLEPVRQYARARLDEGGEGEKVLREHAVFYLALAEEAEPEINGADRDAWRAYLETEHGNLRAALRWSLENGDPQTALRLAGAIFWFWFHRGYWREGRGWLEEALTLPCASAPTAARADALTGLGILAWLQGDHDAARFRLEESLALCRELGYRQGLVQPLHFLSMEMLGRGDEAAARALAEESVEVAREGEERFDLAMALANLGLAAHTQKDYAVARPVLEECAEICRKIGDNWLLSLPYRHLGYMELREGNHERATALFEEGLNALRGVEEKWFVARAVETAAIAAAVRGDCGRAARLFGAGEALREAVGASVQEFYRPDYDRGVAAARASLGEPAWGAALAEGKAMSSGEAVEYALSGETAPRQQLRGLERPPDSKRWDSLTAREQEVALLISLGLTNRLIARELTISERTVDNHVAKILRKLRFHSRAQVAARVAEEGLTT